MKKLLLSLCLMATLGSFLLNAEEKMSPSTQNFLRSYESTSTISQQAKLKSTYAINQNNGEMAVSAFLYLVDENNLDGLEENQVIINAQYGTILSTNIPADKKAAHRQTGRPPSFRAARNCFPGSSRSCTAYAPWCGSSSGQAISMTRSII